MAIDFVYPKGVQQWTESCVVVMQYRIEKLIEKAATLKGIEKLSLLNEYREKVRLYHNITGLTNVYDANFNPKPENF